MLFFTLLILALAPVIAVVVFMYHQDKHEPEPLGHLTVSFIYGVAAMLISTGITYLIYKNIHLQKTSFTDMAIKAFVVVALLEESAKFLFIRGILYRNKNFNEPFDGIIYSLMVGMGFVFTENLIYVFSGDGGTAVIRMFSAVPAHALFAIIMGFFLGEAKLEHRHTFLYGFMALLTATVSHGIYDYFIFVSFVPGFWIGAVVSLIVGYFIAMKAIEIHQEASPFKNEDEENTK